MFARKIMNIANDCFKSAGPCIYSIGKKVCLACTCSFQFRFKQRIVTTTEIIGENNTVININLVCINGYSSPFAVQR